MSTERTNRITLQRQSDGLTLTLSAGGEPLQWIGPDEWAATANALEPDRFDLAREDGPSPIVDRIGAWAALVRQESTARYGAVRMRDDREPHTFNPDVIY